MGGGLLLGAIGFLGAGLALRRAVRRRERIDAALAAAAAAFDDGEVTRSHGGARGRRFGRGVSFLLVRRPTAHEGDEWTRVVADAPGVPLVLDVRPRIVSDQRLADRGLALPVETGDPWFDAAFLVEAAPADVVRALLDAPARARMVSLSPTRLRVGDGAVQVEVRGWLEQPGRIADAVDLAASLAARLRDAYADADEALAAALPPVGAPFRPGLDPRPVRAALAARAGELTALAEVRDQRLRRQIRADAATAAGVVAALVVLFLYLL